MLQQPAESWVFLFWKGLGILAAVLFYGRFYLQWIVSEIRKESVVPVAFWYLSCVGSLMLLGYAAYIQSPVGALSHCFNIIVYTRNLVHIWNEREQLSPARHALIHAIAGVIVVAGVALAASIWLREYHATHAAASTVVRHTWLWLGVGVIGQGLFACRFIVQWIATERQRKSVFPTSFWYFSVAASMLLIASHLHRHEWIFVLGLTATLLIYLRNIWFVRRAQHAAKEALDGPPSPLAMRD